MISLLIGLFFVAGYFIGFVTGSHTGKLQGAREQAKEDFEFLRLKQIEATESEQAKDGEP